MADYSECLKKAGSGDDADVATMRKSLQKKLAAIVATIPGETEPMAASTKAANAWH